MSAKSPAPSGGKLIVIGGSAGALQPLRLMLQNLPLTCPAPLLVVLHMSATQHPGILSEVLASRTGLPVVPVFDNMSLEPGRIYVAVPDLHLMVFDSRVYSSAGPRENGHRPAIDPLFRSAAHSYGKQTIGLLLSGRMDDGTSGLLAIKRRKGTTVVQDPITADQREMPRTAVRVVQPDYIRPPAELAGLLVKLLSREK